MTTADTSLKTIATQDGLQLAAHVYGRGAAVTVVYVHGLLADSGFWQPLIDRISHQTDNWATHLAYDARGHGHSSWPDRHAVSDFGALADDLARVIDSARGPVVLVAHSIGCFVALEFARDHSHYLREKVTELVLFAASGEEPEWAALRAFRPAASAVRWMRRQGPLDAINAAAHRYLSRRLCALAAHAKPGRAQLVPSPRAVDPRVTADICTNAVSAELAADTVRALANTPVLLVTAEHDKVVPKEQTARLQIQLPSAWTQHVEEAGHSFPMVKAELAAPIVAAAAHRAFASATPPGFHGWPHKPKQRADLRTGGID